MPGLPKSPGAWNDLQSKPTACCLVQAKQSLQQLESSEEQTYNCTHLLRNCWDARSAKLLQRKLKQCSTIQAITSTEAISHTTVDTDSSSRSLSAILLKLLSPAWTLVENSESSQALFDLIKEVKTSDPSVNEPSVCEVWRAWYYSIS